MTELLFQTDSYLREFTATVWRNPEKRCRLGPPAFYLG
jgi:Ser-tRNA(Ala) deacylase AlaX